MTDVQTIHSGLLAHWKLEGDARDSSGNGNDGDSKNVDFAAAGPNGKPYTGARFDGKSSVIQIGEKPSFRLGTGEFSLAAWVHTENELDDVLGNIASQFDPEARRGFTLNIKTHAGMTSSQSNYRNVHFGIDNGLSDGEWMDCGRPGRSVFIFSMAVHEGQLFVGTCEPGDGDAGHVYRYGGPGNWSDCGSPDPCNAVSSLATYNGKLYAGVTRYHLPHSGQPDSSNTNPGGKVYRYEGEGKWVDCGQLGESIALHGMAVYQGKLYVTSMYAPAGVFRYEGDHNWVSVGTPDGKRVESLGVYNGHLYGTGYDSGVVFRYDGGTDWSLVGEPPDTTQTYAFAVYEGKQYVSTWPTATVYRNDGDHNWTDCGRIGQEREAMGMAIYNGKLYVGSLPHAEVYRYEGGAFWTRLKRLDFTPDVLYRRAWTMAVFQGKLFCGTLPSGHIHSLEVGKSATYDHPLEPGWRHLVAVRGSDKLQLYVDGALVVTTATPPSAEYDIANESPFYLGFGDHDHFNGTLSDVRLYGRALTEAEVAALYRQGNRD